MNVFVVSLWFHQHEHWNFGTKEKKLVKRLSFNFCTYTCSKVILKNHINTSYLPKHSPIYFNLPHYCELL